LQQHLSLFEFSIGLEKQRTCAAEKMAVILWSDLSSGRDHTIAPLRQKAFLPKHEARIFGSIAAWRAMDEIPSRTVKASLGVANNR
jgi:hypothetical protein